MRPFYTYCYERADCKLFDVTIPDGNHAVRFEGLIGMVTAAQQCEENTVINVQYPESLGTQYDAMMRSLYALKDSGVLLRVRKGPCVGGVLYTRPGRIVRPVWYAGVALSSTRNWFFGPSRLFEEGMDDLSMGAVDPEQYGAKFGDLVQFQIDWGATTCSGMKRRYVARVLRISTPEILGDTCAELRQNLGMLSALKFLLCIGSVDWLGEADDESDG